MLGHYSEDFIDLIEKMTAFDPTKRLTMADAEKIFITIYESGGDHGSTNPTDGSGS